MSGIKSFFNRVKSTTIISDSLTYSVSIAAIIILVAGLTACGSGDATEKVQPEFKAPPGSLSALPTPDLIDLPAPTPISLALRQKLHDGCEAWYDQRLRSTGFNGGMLVAKNGNIIFEQYKGMAHIGGKDTITANTPFQIASVSKTFTAMTVLKLYQDSLIKLDDLFSKYFPQFNYPGVTIRDMLSHRSGLPNYLYFLEDLHWDETKFATNEDVLSLMISHKAELKNISAPNTHFEYCNTNYALLALLVEKVTGKKFPDYIQQTFFTPLQMTNTFIFNPDSMATANRSYDYRGRIEKDMYLDKVYGDKDVYTTPRDLLIWDRALTTGTLFKPETITEAYTPYSNERRGIRNYGLGWRMFVFPSGKKIIYHNGWWHGSNASFIRMIQDSATIIILGNKFNRNIYHAKELAGLFGNYGGKNAEEEENDSVEPGTVERRRVVHARRRSKRK
ncbi:MAG TPA: serine hydrolase domain-containing protein [Ferruginibacter sp.]|nr:serine hydrolase domain-containing protein [Ferruginibacter sp.]